MEGSLTQQEGEAVTLRPHRVKHRLWALADTVQYAGQRLLQQMSVIVRLEEVPQPGRSRWPALLAWRAPDLPALVGRRARVPKLAPLRVLGGGRRCHRMITGADGRQGGWTGRGAPYD